MKRNTRKKENSFLRFMFNNGVSLTSLIAVIYYAGVIVERNDTQNVKLSTVETTVTAISNLVQDIKIDVAVVKSRVDALEKQERTRQWQRSRENSGG